MHCHCPLLPVQQLELFQLPELKGCNNNFALSIWSPTPGVPFWETDYCMDRVNMSLQTLHLDEGWPDDLLISKAAAV